MAGQHQAAIIPEKGSRFTIVNRTTPEPGPNELLVETKAIAVNPVDFAQRDLGFPPIPSYPAVVGSDVAGIVIKAGANVPADAPKPGDRVVAFASAFYQNGSADHGGFQKYVLAAAEGVVSLPDSISFEEGAILPLATLTALSGWTTIGIPLDTYHTPEQKQAVLIWGGSSSVGSMAIQSARSMGFIVYATASEKHHNYLQKLGATCLFDYKAENAVSQIVAAARADSVTLTTAYCAVPGALPPTLEVLKQLKGDSPAKIAHAPPLLPGAPILDGIETKFVLPPMDPVQRSEHIYKGFRVWLQQGLATGSVTPSPHVQVVDGGLKGLNDAVDLISGGVSGTKLVVQV